MKILLNQKFGLGNQLFQYAAGLYFAKQYGASLEIIREDTSTAESYGHPRPFLLDRFNISTPVRTRTLLDRVLRSESPRVVKFARPIRSLCRSHSVDPLFTIVGEYQHSLPIPRNAKRIYLNGHFQVRQYAEAMEPQLRQEFSFREPASGKNLDTLNQIRRAKCPVSLHFRRGDYVVGWKGQNLLPMVYYDNAIAAMREIASEPTFFVFSDDIASARESCRELQSAVFVDNNDEANPQEDLRLIAACRHHILANSTFSWWGAWLNPNPDKVVIAPDPWHVTDEHPNLLPPSWHRVPSQAAMAVSRS